jgi:glycosyltransferase involved in cell wall biosynthesis
MVYIPIPIDTKKEVSPKILRCLFRLSGLIKKYNIDLVHSHTRTTQVLGALLNKFTAVSHVSTCHGFFKPRLFRKIFPCWGEKVIAISESVKEHLIEDFHVRESDIRVIHNGIDVEKFSPAGGFAFGEKIKTEIKNNLGLSDGPTIGIVARLSDVKGHIYLIRAMELVLKQFPHAQLLIIGEGKMKGELVGLTKRLGIQENIFFIPEVSDTKEVLSIMDIFVMPSLKEGLGLALMEAMASGLAVIGSDVGGIKSLIQDGSNGLLVKPADINGLAQKILELLQDQRKREALGKAAKLFIQQNFSHERMVLETERVYLECLNTAD